MEDALGLTPERLAPLVDLEGQTPDEIRRVFHAAVRHIISGQQPAVAASSNAASSAAVDSAGSRSAHTATALQQAQIESAKDVLVSAAQRGLDAATLETDLRQRGVSASVAAAAAACWGAQGSASRRAMLVSEWPIRNLLDVEWTFGVTASSSEQDAVGATYVQLRLTVGTESGAPEYVHFELSLPRYYEFLHELESIKAQLEVI